MFAGLPACLLDTLIGVSPDDNNNYNDKKQSWARSFLSFARRPKNKKQRNKIKSICIHKFYFLIGSAIEILFLMAFQTFLLSFPALYCLCVNLTAAVKWLMYRIDRQWGTDLSGSVSRRTHAYPTISCCYAGAGQCWCQQFKIWYNFLWLNSQKWKIAGLAWPCKAIEMEAASVSVYVFIKDVVM